MRRRARTPRPPPPQTDELYFYTQFLLEVLGFSYEKPTLQDPPTETPAGVKSHGKQGQGEGLTLALFGEDAAPRARCKREKSHAGASDTSASLRGFNSSPIKNVECEYFDCQTTGT